MVVAICEALNQKGERGSEKIRGFSPQAKAGNKKPRGKKALATKKPGDNGSWQSGSKKNSITKNGFQL